MSLKNYQTALTLSKLYACKVGYSSHGGDQLKPNIWVNSGTVDIYTSNSATQPANLAAMTLGTSGTGVGPEILFNAVYNYIAVVQDTGTTTELNISGVDVELLGAIT